MANTPYTSQQPINDFSLRFASPGLLFSATIAATTDTTLTIPGAALTPGVPAKPKAKYKALIKIARFSSGTTYDVWVAYNQVAAPPAGATFAVSTSEMINETNVLCREVDAGDVLHFYSATAAVDVSVVLYSLNSNN